MRGSFFFGSSGAVQALRSVGGECECSACCFQPLPADPQYAALIALYGLLLANFDQSYWTHAPVPSHWVYCFACSGI